jgi:hypothetical protein
MASEVDIVNIALSHLGDTANVSSIDPPEGSAQAQHAARFYPIARDALLEMHPWSFTTKRIVLPLLSNQLEQWKYVYQAPSDVLNIMAVLAPDAMDDYSQDLPVPYTQVGIVNTGQGLYTPQPYEVETLQDGTQVIYTNQEEATLRYTAKITDTTHFSPLFTSALTHLLASYLAGPVLKGEVGRVEAKGQLQLFQAFYAKATASDSSQRRIIIKQSTPWMAGR